LEKNMRKDGKAICKAMLAVAGVLSVALAPPAFAQGMGRGMGQGMGQGMGPVAALCAKDIDAYCAQTPRGPAMRACLEGRIKELSENCRVAVESTGPGRGPGTGPVARLCVSEIDKFCPEVEHVGGQVRACLEQHNGELGEACATALNTTGPGRRR
jgi:hypothetical protein